MPGGAARSAYNSTARRHSLFGGYTRSSRLLWSVRVTTTWSLGETIVSIRLEKPWISVAQAAQLPGQLGVFQLANRAGDVIYVGAAGARALFGLRSEVIDRASEFAAESFRAEVTMAYHTRRLELLMVYRADHGVLPEHNREDEIPGRLSPA